MFRLRYVVEAQCAEHAQDEVVMNYGGELSELSQKHIDESIISTREIDICEYHRVFDEDNDYLKSWDEKQKLGFVNVIDYDKR
tara:strand:+ start:6791 stop:7039 length:249 start_codon:yes stop_codon:yes gene_type:complete